MLPLRSVGRSNFVRVLRKNFTTLIQKRHILMRTAVLYIYIYIYIISRRIITPQHIKYNSMSLDVVQSLYFGSLLPKCRDCAASLSYLTHLTLSYIYIHVCVCIYIYVCTYVYMYIYVCIYVYICVYAFIYLQ